MLREHETANSAYDEGCIKIQVRFKYYLIQTMQQRILLDKRNMCELRPKEEEEDDKRTAQWEAF